MMEGGGLTSNENAVLKSDETLVHHVLDTDPVFSIRL
jgi:hypothetical protein